MNVGRNMGLTSMFMIFLFELLGYAASNSWNPQEFWSPASSLVKAGLVVLGGLSILSVINWIVTGFISENAECGDPQCKNPNVRTFMGVYGGVMRCPRCKRWYHKACWQRLHRGRSLTDIATNGCFRCGAGAEGEPARRVSDRDSIFRDFR